MLDPATGAVTDNAVVVLRDGRILGAGTWDQTRGARAAVGGAAQQVDVRGAWILPGLVDVHVHVNALADAAGILQAGATTVRSGASNFYQDVAMRPLTTWTPGQIPRMRAAGTFISPILGDTVLGDEALAPLASLPGGVQEPADLRYFTAVNLSRGVDVIKTRANPRAGLAEQDPLELVYDEEQLSAVVAEARRGKAGVLCHAYSAEGCRGAVRAGIASLEHGVFVDEETLDLMARRRTAFTPTMAAITGLLESSDPVLVERGREYVPVLQEALRVAHAKGVPIVAGTDTFGTATQPVGKEVRLIAEAGIPALDALRGATTTASALLGLADKVGRLVPGYHADVVAVDGNPLETPPRASASGSSWPRERSTGTTSADQAPGDRGPLPQARCERPEVRPSVVIRPAPGRGGCACRWRLRAPPRRRRRAPTARRWPTGSRRTRASTSWPAARAGAAAAAPAARSAPSARTRSERIGAAGPARPSCRTPRCRPGRGRRRQASRGRVCPAASSRQWPRRWQGGGCSSW
jgi:imidazolonepropionase-like amidohydrolase